MADDNEQNEPGRATVESPRGPTTPRRLRRGPGGHLGGVAHGLAHYFDVDPGLVEVALVVLTVVSGGAAVPAYLAAWLLIPAADDPDPRPFRVVETPLRLVTGVLVLLIAAGAVLGKIVYSVTGLDFTLGGNTGPLMLPALLIGVGVALLGRPARDEARDPVPDSPPPAAGPDSSGRSWAITRTAEELAGSPPPGPNITAPVDRPPVTAITLAVVGAVVGAMALVDQTLDVHIGLTTYAATVTTLIGLGLVVAAFVSRALSLILLGVLALLFLALSPIVESGVSGGFGPRKITVTEADALQDSYEVGAGYISLDLSHLVLTHDAQVRIRVGAGYAKVIVPPDMPVEVTGTAAVGYVRFFGREVDGLRNRLAVERPGEGPTLSLVFEVGFGYGSLR